MRAPAFSFFFFNDTATTEIYTLSLHDALPISGLDRPGLLYELTTAISKLNLNIAVVSRSEEHTSELQSLRHLVCRLLLEKKKKITSLLRALQPPTTHASPITSNITDSTTVALC